MMLSLVSILAEAEEKVEAATVPPITFVVTAALAVAIMLLGFDLVRRVRRARYRAEIAESLAAEVAERDAAAAQASEATDSGDAAPTDTHGSDASPTEPDHPHAD